MRRKNETDKNHGGFNNFYFVLQTIPFTALAGISQHKTATETELYQSYETFMQYADDNNLPVIFDFESFKEEYYLLEDTSIDEYLDVLYSLFIPSTDFTSEKLTGNDDFIDSSNWGNYRPTYIYSDEFLDEYECLISYMDENDLPVELSLEDFEDGYAGSKFNNISEYSNFLYVELNEMYS